MRAGTNVRGAVNSRVLWALCIVVVACVAGHHIVIRSYVGDRFDRFFAKCCRDCPDPCPTAAQPGEGEPPYFSGFRLHNSATNPAHVIKEVKVEVKKDPPDGGLWSLIPDSAFEPPPPPSIPPMGIWMPMGNNAPEPIWGVRVLIRLDGETDFRVAAVEGLGGKPDAEVDVVVEELTWMDDDGNPITDLVVRVWVWYDFAGGTPSVAYGDSRP